MSEHTLDLKARPAACSCGGWKAAGSPTFVRARHAVHVQDVTTAETQKDTP